MIKDADLERLANMLQVAGGQGFTGSIQINFFKGSVTNVVKQESFKLEDIAK